MKGNRRTKEILTPEGVMFSIQIAGPTTRFLAWLIDFLLIMVLGSTLSTLLALTVLISPGFYQAATTIVVFVVSVGYSILLEWKLKGQTLGKRVLKIRVIDERGLNLRFSQIVIRNLMRFVDMLPGLYAVGGTSSILSQQGQRLGDFVANTLVVHSQTGSALLSAKLKPLKFNSFNEFPHLEARLRQLTEPKEIKLAIDALIRRKEFSSKDRILLFKELKNHFSKKVTFPEEIVSTMSDEAYIKNVIDTVFSFTYPLH